MVESFGDPIEVAAGDRQVVITSPNKVFFTHGDLTKLDLVRYYLSVESAVMRQMGDRPVLLQRFPNGAHGSNFFQKRIPDGAPDWLQTTTVSTPNGTESRALVIADIAHLLWAVNLGCLGFHSWPYLVSTDPLCDELRIDLDPGPGTTYAMCVEAAHEVHRLLGDLGVQGWIKTSGNRGLHVYVRLAPEHDGIAVRSAAVAVARELERRRPDLLTASWWKEQRGARIFVDFNQNAPHKTVFAPWSVRALPHAQVSYPFAWPMLDAIVPPELTIAMVPALVNQHGDAWATMADQPQPLAPFLDMVRSDQQAGIPDAPWPPVYPKMAGEPPRVAPSRARKPPPTTTTSHD
jgi:DNA ligase D